MMVLNIAAAVLLLLACGASAVQSRWNRVRALATYGSMLDLALAAAAVLMFANYQYIDRGSFYFLGAFLAFRIFFRTSADFAYLQNNRERVLGSVIILMATLPTAVCFKALELGSTTTGWKHALSLANTITLVLAALALILVIVTMVRAGASNPLLKGITKAPSAENNDADATPTE